ncbi:MAG: O-antigen ligase family protein [candidate division Zixibacteria bacterium]|nr:O-antigen ligase family protein [candidate division Zixibacteria bacterium]
MMEISDSKTYLTGRSLAYVGLVVLSSVLALGLVHGYAFICFALVLGGLWVLTGLCYPFVGLLCYTIFILVRPQEFIAGLAFPMIEKVIVAPVLVGMILKMIRQSGSKIAINSIDKRVAFFVIIALLSVLTSIWIGGAFDKWINVLRLFIIYVLIGKLIDSKQQFRLYLFFIILTTGFHAVASTINYYQGVRQFTMGVERAVGLDQTYGAPNSLAATIVYTLPFIYFYIKSDSARLTRLFLFVLFGICVWCIILTGSRTGMLAIVFVSFVMALEARHRLRNLLVGALVLAAIWVVTPDQYKDRFASSVDFDSGTGAARSAQGRIQGLVNGIKMMIDRPLLGVGVGQYPVALSMRYGKGWWEAHSLPGQLMGDLGLLGTIAFIVWIATLFRSLARTKRLYADDVFIHNMIIALRVQLLCLLFMGLGGHNLYRYNWFFISALTAVILRLPFASEETNAQPLQREG